MKIALKPEDERFIEEEVASGRYGSGSEVIGAALELLQSQTDLTPAEEQKLVQHAIDQIERGEYGTLESEADVNALADEVCRRSKEKRGQKARRPA